ncbi:MAG: SDR family NAD(P)-dependent oxidoreductase [Sporichthyaceae bacterium]
MTSALRRASSMLDTALDRTVALGYGNVGLAIRRRLPTWPADPPRMDGKVVLVTGAASGLGLAASVGFARLGAAVLALGRDQARAQEAVDLARRQVGDEAELRPVACDLSDRSELQRFIEALRRDEPRLDVLVNNAGVMPDERTHAAEGVELTFATHVLAPWILIDGLASLLGQGEAGRVINVSSAGQYDQKIPAGDLQSEHTKYGPKKIYARTKREQLVLTEQWAQRLRDENVVVHAMHPGWADTKGVRNWMPLFRRLTRPIIRTPEQGADTIVWLGGAPEPATCSGLFWHDRRPRPTTYLIGAGTDPQSARQELWDHTEALAREPRSSEV